MPHTTYLTVCALISDKKVRASTHAFAQCAKRGILITEVIRQTPSSLLIEDYPDYHVGPAILVLLFDGDQRPIHAVWGLEKGTQEPAVLVTAYRPDPDEWEADFRTRKQ